MIFKSLEVRSQLGSYSDSVNRALESGSGVRLHGGKGWTLVSLQVNQLARSRDR